MGILSLVANDSFIRSELSFLGLSSARSNVEAIALAWDLHHGLAFSGLELQSNSLGNLEDRH